MPPTSPRKPLDFLGKGYKIMPGTTTLQNREKRFIAEVFKRGFNLLSRKDRTVYSRNRHCVCVEKKIEIQCQITSMKNCDWLFRGFCSAILAGVQTWSEIRCCLLGKTGIRCHISTAYFQLYELERILSTECMTGRRGNMITRFMA